MKLNRMTQHDIKWSQKTKFKILGKIDDKAYMPTEAPYMAKW